MNSPRSETLHRLLTALAIVIGVLGFLGCAPPERDGREQSVSNVGSSEKAININTATIVELETLPGIGETLAKRIVEYRDKNGKFRRPEHLMLVPGVSERRFRQIRDRIRTD